MTGWVPEPNSSLGWTDCAGRCGARTLTVRERAGAARCGPCLSLAAGVKPGPRTLPGPVIGYGFPPGAGPRPEPDTPAEYPDVAVGSRSPRPAGVITPTPVLKLQEDAQGFGWRVHLQYAKGWMPHATTGRPTKLVETFCLRLHAHPGTRRQALAAYTMPDKAWKLVYVWGPDLPPYGELNVTDLREFLSAPAGWTADGVRARRAEQARAAAETEARRKADEAAGIRPKRSAGWNREAGG